MQGEAFFRHRRTTVALCMVLLMLTQQVWAGPLVPHVQSGVEQRTDSSGTRTLRRAARMTPLWRIMNSKPFGAYCQNNYECSSGHCSDGHCSNSHRAPSKTVNY